MGVVVPAVRGVSQPAEDLAAGYISLIDKATQHSVKPLTFSDTAYDPIYGLVPITAAERAIISSSGFGLLRDKLQMMIGLTERCQDMTHARYEHSIGAMHIAGVAAARLGLNATETQLARMVALLHDFAHLPFSHALDMFTRDRNGYDHDDHVGIFLKESGVGEVIDCFRAETGISAKQIGGLLTSAHKSEGASRNRLIKWVAKQFADRADYLARDLHYAPISEDTKRLAFEVQSKLVHGLEVTGANEACYPAHMLETLQLFGNFRTFLFGNFSLHPWAQTVHHILARSLAAAAKKDAYLLDGLVDLTDQGFLKRLHDAGLSDPLPRLLKGSIDRQTTQIIAFHMEGFSREEITKLERLATSAHHSSMPPVLRQIAREVAGTTHEHIQESPDDFFFGVTRSEEVKSIPIVIRRGNGELQQLNMGGGLPASACLLFMISPRTDYSHEELTTLRRKAMLRVSIASGVPAERIYANLVDLEEQELLVPESYLQNGQVNDFAAHAASALAEVRMPRVAAIRRR